MLMDPAVLIPPHVFSIASPPNPRVPRTVAFALVAIASLAFVLAPFLARLF